MKQHNCINRSPKLKTTPLLLAQTDTSTLFMKNTLIPFSHPKNSTLCLSLKCLPPTKPPAVLVHLKPLAMLKRTWDAAVQSVEALSPRKVQPYPSPGGKWQADGEGKWFFFVGWVFWWVAKIWILFDVWDRLQGFLFYFFRKSDN